MRDVLTFRLHFKVNTLDETSRIQMRIGTNYTIGHGLVLSSSILERGRFPQESSGASCLEPVFLHQVAEGTVGDPKHVGGLGLNSAALVEGTLQ